MDLKYRNILVVTDNHIQYDRFKALLAQKNYRAATFTFRHSPGSPLKNHPDFQHADAVVNVKQQADSLIKEYDLIFSLHCTQLFPAALVKSVKCINIHPGYNPVNRGWYPQVFAIVHNLIVGATIHEMDELLDNGDIIARKKIETHIWDTSLSIYNRVLQAEMELLEDHLDAILAAHYETIKPEPGGNIFLKKDFNALRQIDPNETGTFLSFYNKLRALSHHPYKNAYFIDPATGKRINISISIEAEGD